MSFRPTLTMGLGPILIQKIRYLIMRITWMINHVIVQCLQTGVVSQQIKQKEIFVETFAIFLDIVVSIKVARCLSDQMNQ